MTPQIFRTPITELFGIDHPILCGGLMWLADAAYVGSPEDETIYYFYNPFSREVLAAVLDIITASYHERPRRLYVVLVDSGDGDLVMQTGIFGRFNMSRFDRLRARLLSPYPIAIYRSVA